MSNYQRGTDLERAVRAQLAEDGYDVFRSAGSKTPADLIGFKHGEILFVQCKLDGVLRLAERREFWLLACRHGALPLVGYWHKEGRAARVPAFYRLLGTEVGQLIPWIPDYAMEA